jgi:hypothetical protein
MEEGRHYDVFHRTWWKNNPEWPDGLEPQLGRKTYIARGVTREEALKLCEEYARTHKPGRLSRKAEFEER